jgi:hypothetical protein
MDRKLNIAKVGPFLKSVEDPTIIGEMWIVFRMPGKLPQQSFDAIPALLTMLERMDVERTGHITYEAYSRCIQRSISKASTVGGSEEGGGGGANNNNARVSETGFSGSVVGMDPRAVKSDAKILIVRMKELNSLPPGDP